ncbi:MAG TPA: hypothetical protein VEI97_14385 [bacterium]|nr:hypothetical protein [bacterium]
MLDDYLDQPARVRLLTGEMLPEGVKFWGQSPLGGAMLWFGVSRRDAPLEVEQEFHVPASSIAQLEIIRKS